MLRRIRKEGLSFLAYERCLDQVVDDAAGVALMVSNGTRGGWRLRSSHQDDRVSFFLRGLFAVHVFLYGL